MSAFDVVKPSMPHGSESVDETQITWQQSLRLAIRSVDALCRQLNLNPEAIGALQPQADGFPLFVPREFLARMAPGDPRDPLLLQVLPRMLESQAVAGFGQDPVGDQFVEVVPGLLHKYEGRVLLIASGACAVHCRYCFRRHFPYETAPKSVDQWEQAFEYIESEPSVHEVILSGGDPLMLVDSRLRAMMDRLESISHLRRIRIHTRLPVVIPSRVDRELCEWLSKTRLSKWIVLHINHRNELDDHLVQAIRRLQATGAVILNQAVLLREVNDSVQALRDLMERLIDVGVVPYYLHQLDRVDGAAHFEVPAHQGLEMIDALQRLLPGYAVPRFVREVSGEASKVSVSASQRLFEREAIS